MKTVRALWGLGLPLLVVACASAPEPKSIVDAPVATPEPVAASTPGPAPLATSVSAVADDTSGPKCTVRCEGAQIATVKGASIATTDADSKTKAEVENANVVLGGKNDDFVRCYRPRLRAAPGTQGTVTFDILIGADGHVVKITPFGGEKLGTVDDCMLKVIQDTVFAPPHGGGTLMIRVPFTLSAQGLEEST